MPAAKGLHARIAAVKAYHIASPLLESKQKKEGWELFNKKFAELARDNGVSKNYRRKFARKWVKRFEKQGDVHELPRRKPRMPSEVARELGEMLMEGREVVYTAEVRRGKKVVKEQRTKRLWYRSIGEFCETNAVVEKKMAEYKIKHSKTLLRDIRKACPELKRGQTKPKAPLTAAHKLQRKRFAFKLLGMVGVGVVSSGLDLLRHYLYRCIWIDSKTLYVCPQSMKVWAPKGADMTDYDERVPRNKKPAKIVYYIAVNAILGPVYFELVTGTANHEEDPFYQQYTSEDHPETPASGVTRKDFINFMRRTVAACGQLLALGENKAKWEETLGPVPVGEERLKYELHPPPAGGFAPHWRPIYSCDNPSIYGGKAGSPTHGAVLQAIGLSRCEVFDLPVRSSDIHKVVEHAHGRVQEVFTRWFYSDPTPYEIRAVKGVVSRAVYEPQYGVTPPEVIAPDTDSLIATLVGIAVRAGAEIPKPLR